MRSWRAEVSGSPTLGLFDYPLRQPQPIVGPIKFGPKQRRIIQSVGRQPPQAINVVTRLDPPHFSRGTAAVAFRCQQALERLHKFPVPLRKRERIGESSYGLAEALLELVFRVAQFVFYFLPRKLGEPRMRNGVRAELDAAVSQLAHLTPGQTFGAVK